MITLSERSLGLFSHVSRSATVVLALATALDPQRAASQPSAPPPSPRPYSVGNPLGVVSSSPSDSSPRFAPMSATVSVYGGIHNAESCSYDAERGLIVVVNRGVAQRVQTNDAFVSLLKHDGSIHTSRWIGVQPAPMRMSLTPPLTLNEPFGSEIAGGVLYLADSDGNTGPNDPRVAVIRKFDIKTGRPIGEVRVERSHWLNDLAVARDGTIYATQTGGLGAGRRSEFVASAEDHA
jgi:hypothetical protein